MPIKIPNRLPARAVLDNENIFVMTETRAIKQDIRPLKILIFNLMPTKIETETQLLRLLGNSPLQVDATFLQASTHVSKNTSADHLIKFYTTFDRVKDDRYDGLIITGAPVENMPFEQVDYWEELCEVMAWSKKNVHSTLHICWGAQAGLFYHYGIKKQQLPQKLSGVYSHTVCDKTHMLMRGFDDLFYAPHSRYTGVDREEVLACEKLVLLSESEQAGAYIIASKNGRRFFVTGHSEYDADTLAKEYRRDIDKGLDVPVPCNYFENNDPSMPPVQRWRAHANLLFSNWLNYYVYQTTPYDITEIKETHG